MSGQVEGPYRTPERPRHGLREHDARPVLAKACPHLLVQIGKRQLLEPDASIKRVVPGLLALGRRQAVCLLLLRQPPAPELLGQFPQRVRMGRALDQHPVHVRNGPGRVLHDQAARPLDAEKIAVDAASAPLRHAEPVTHQAPAKPLFQPFRAVLRGEHDAARNGEPFGTVRFRVPMQASEPLQENIHRAEVGHEEIGVDVERLLQGLGADDHATAGLAAFLAERLLHGFVQQSAILRRETAVVQRRPASRP